MPQDTITYGPVHLRVTNLDTTKQFWEEIIGLPLLSEEQGVAEFGTEKNTLVKAEATATTPFHTGYSGLYHLALHVPSELDFALILARLIHHRWPISPTDHIMSKAIYLTDPDGITIEITLETPERFSHYNMHSGKFQVIDATGAIRGATEALDVRPLLALLSQPDLTQPLPPETTIGHVHLYVPDLADSYDFYQGLGFVDNLISVPIGFADLSVGGIFPHRLAMNTWQSLGAPPAPEHMAGMKNFAVKLSTEKQLEKIRAAQDDIVAIDGGYRLQDPAGNSIILTIQS